MKLLIAALFSLSAFAAEPILLNAAKIELPASVLKESIVLIRDANTPDMVELIIPSHPQKQCVKYETQQVYGEDRSCGSFTVPVCSNQSFNCETRTRCGSVRWSNGDCPFEEMYQECQNRIVCNDETRYVSCYHPGQVCVEEQMVDIGKLDETLHFQLKKRHAKKTHKLLISVNPYNGVQLTSGHLSVQQAIGGFLIKK